MGYSVGQGEEKSTPLSILSLNVTSDFESEVKQFRGFLHRLAFPLFSTRFFYRFFHLQHKDFTENIYRTLIEQTGHKTTTLFAPQRQTFRGRMFFFISFLEF